MVEVEQRSEQLLLSEPMFGGNHIKSMSQFLGFVEQDSQTLVSILSLRDGMVVFVYSFSNTEVL
jgi:hypothetical protein